MPALVALQSVQYVTVKGKRLAVLDAEDWGASVEWLETLEVLDTGQVLAAFRKANGDREKAGWFSWEEIQREW